VVRLAFSVAVNVDPDILIIDEVLAVGDQGFQAKCYQKIVEFERAGKTLLFVSHATQAVQQFCRRALWLEKGRLVMDGRADEVVAAYNEASSGITYSKETEVARSCIVPAAVLCTALLSSCSSPEPAATGGGHVVSPAAGSGISGQFAFHIPQDANAAAFVQVLFGNTRPTAPPFCFVHYDPAKNELKLYRGPGVLDFTEGAVPGTRSDTVQNNFCQVDTFASSASRTPSGIDLKLAVTFKAPLAGDRVIYYRILDSAQKDSGWQRAGTWTIPTS
jgi:hypothetical protein